MRKLIAATTLAASLTLMPATIATVHAQDDAVAESDGAATSGCGALPVSWASSG